MKKYSAALFMLALGLVCLGLHFAFGWNAFKSDAQEHQTSAQMSSYLVTWGRDVFENLQSEFIQLFFQFLLLAGFFKFIKIMAYEEDVEEVKQRLDRIEALLKRSERSVSVRSNGHTTPSITAHPDHITAAT
jgi:hypothetical protein